MEGQKYLVTGASGQLGYELHQQLKLDGQSLPKTRETLNIANFEWVYKWLKASQPDAIVNCAGYTNVPRAEQDRDACWAANVYGVHNLACCASRLDIPLIHISTDFVFGQDFSRSRPYRESDPVAPLNFYGQSKAHGEHALLRWAAVRPFSWWIIRSAGLFERPWRHRMNFPNAIQQALECRAQKTVEVVQDVTTNLTYAPHLAKVIVWLLRHRDQVVPGIYHVTNGGECGWFEVADHLARSTRFRHKLRAVSRKDYARNHRRDVNTMPRFTCLTNDRYNKLDGPPMPTWREALDEWSHGQGIPGKGAHNPVMV